jgi:hypothetical protein
LKTRNILPPGPNSYAFTGIFCKNPWDEEVDEAVQGESSSEEADGDTSSTYNPPIVEVSSDDESDESHSSTLAGEVKDLKLESTSSKVWDFGEVPNRKIVYMFGEILSFNELIFWFYHNNRNSTSYLRVEVKPTEEPLSTVTVYLDARVLMEKQYSHFESTFMYKTLE